MIVGSQLRTNDSSASYEASLASDPKEWEPIMTMQTPGFDVIRHAVGLACRAPSLHNSQPWRWITDGTTLDLFADAGRLIPAADPQGREITLSCGAALDHLILAMSVAGWNTNVQRIPDQYTPYHLAR